MIRMARAAVVAVFALTLMAALPVAAGASAGAPASSPETMVVSWTPAGFTYVGSGIVEGAGSSILTTNSCQQLQAHSPLANCIRTTTYQNAAATGTFTLRSSLREIVVAPGLLSIVGEWGVVEATGIYGGLHGGGTLEGSCQYRINVGSVTLTGHLSQP